MTLKEIKEAAYSYELKHGMHHLKINSAYNPNRPLGKKTILVKGSSFYMSRDGINWLRI